MNWGRFASLAMLLAACGGDDDSGEGSLQDAAAPSDAFSSDASVVDCAGDHRESAERGNDPLSAEDGSAEMTGYALNASSEPFTVCGQIDPAQSNSSVVDEDTYQFRIGGEEPVNVRLEMVAPTGGEATGLALDLHQVDEGTPVFVATGPFRNDYSLVAGIPLEPGNYWVTAVAFDPQPERTVGYSIEIGRNELTCPRADGTPSFTESGDGALDRSNDTVSIHYPSAPTLTGNLSDAPEATGVVLSPAEESVHLRGQSADVMSDNDSYLDRDAYLIRTGAMTSELEVRLSWPDTGVDLDVYLFAAGDPGVDYSTGLGTTVAQVADELFTVNVDPGTNYWLWVGAYDNTSAGEGLPLVYDLTLCPRTHE
jgi:hypothetical protein